MEPGLWVSNDGGDSGRTEVQGCLPKTLQPLYSMRIIPIGYGFRLLKKVPITRMTTTWKDGDLYGAYVFDLDFVTSAKE